MYKAARSVVDAMRHRSRLGETLALSALGRYLRRSKRGGVSELQHIAGVHRPWAGSTSSSRATCCSPSSAHVE
ncbi:hypothetical protein [Streptomyces sp. NPDC001076]